MTDNAAPPRTHCDLPAQATLLETDSEFWKIMRELIRAELSHFVTSGKVKWDRRPKGPEFWAESIARVVRVASRFGYASNQLLKSKDPYFAMEEFSHPQQINRLLDRVARTEGFVRFRLDNNPRSAWFITRRDWLQRAQRKASFEKDKTICANVNWGLELAGEGESEHHPEGIPQGIENDESAEVET